MKNYFVVETNEICNFGDVLSITMVKELNDGKVTVEKNVEFNENTMDWMIEMGFVQEREDENENTFDSNSEEEPCEALEALKEDFEALEQKVETMEEMIKGIYDVVNTAAKCCQYSC